MSNQVIEADGVGVSKKLKEAAEMEMGRFLPDDAPPTKRSKTGSGEAGDDVANEAPQAPAVVARFDYSATNDLSTPSGIQGFLYTCKFRREQSSTKELGRIAINILNPTKTSEDTTDDKYKLSIIKVGARGLGVIKLSTQSDDVLSSQQAVLDVARVLTEEVESGKRDKFQHIQRIMPVHSSGIFNSVEALTQAGQQLGGIVANILKDLENPTFAVGLKSRYIVEKPAAGTENTDELDRATVIKSVAGGLESVLRDTHKVQVKVDLKNPHVVILIEEVIVGSETYAILGAVPADLCVLKPKFAMKFIGKN